MNTEVDTHQFFTNCHHKGNILYLGKEAHCFWDENYKCFAITQMEEDCYESIYEDQVEAVYSINEKEFLILAKNGEESILSYNFSSR